MKKLTLLLIATVIASNAHAGPVRDFIADKKLPQVDENVQQFNSGEPVTRTNSWDTTKTFNKNNNNNSATVTISKPGRANTTINISKDPTE